MAAGRAGLVRAVAEPPPRLPEVSDVRIVAAMRNATRTKGEATPEAEKGAADALRLRLVFGPRRILGPGRIELLDAIERTGSLAAAGRAMRMSYKRAWTLVEELNATFDEPLVELSRGGSGHGGAVLTPLGREMAARYRRMLEATRAAIADDLEAMGDRLRRPQGEDTSGAPSS